MLTLDVNRVRWMLRYHKELKQEFRYVCAVFDLCGGELISKRKAK